MYGKKCLRVKEKWAIVGTLVAGRAPRTSALTTTSAWRWYRGFSEEATALA